MTQPLAPLRFILGNLIRDPEIVWQEFKNLRLVACQHLHHRFQLG